MEKIYSRSSFKMPRLKKFTKIKFALALSFLGLLFILISFFASVYPIFEEACKSKAESIGIDITSKEVNNVMTNFDYDDLVYVEKGESRRYSNDKSQNCSDKQNNF